MYVRSVCFSPDGKYLATGAEDTQIKVGLPISRQIGNIYSRLSFSIDLGHLQQANPQYL